MSDASIREIADALVSSGMSDAGYEYVIIDDCWQGQRTAGALTADPARFPEGLAAVATYVHSVGLKLGVHVGIGSETCAGDPGSLGTERQDMATLATAGVDYVQADDCNTAGLDPRYQYRVMREAIGKTQRPMMFSILGGLSTSPWVWAAEIAQLWRIAGGTPTSWNDVLGSADVNANFAGAAGPTRWNDPNVLLAGVFVAESEEELVAQAGGGGEPPPEPTETEPLVPALTPIEERSQMSLWALMASPLVAANDPRSVSPETLETLTNEEIIAINQDEAGAQAVRVRNDEVLGIEVWSKPLEGTGARAVALLNRSSKEVAIPVTWSAIGLANASATVRDVWDGLDLGSYPTSYTADVPAHGVVVLRVTGQEPLAPKRRTYLSDMTPTYAAGGWGPVERDHANGGQEAEDGASLRLNGLQYAKGLGTNSHSRIRYVLGERCYAFTAAIGIDDSANPPWDPYSRRGSVYFEVWGDGVRLFRSTVMHSDTATGNLSLNVSGVQTLELVVDPAADSTNSDYADWANAVVNCI